MHALKLSATIDSTRRLQLELPADTPEGEAEVIVLVDEQASVAAGDSLRAYFLELDAQPLHKKYTREDIDRYLAEERASWGGM